MKGFARCFIVVSIFIGSWWMAFELGHWFVDWCVK